MQTDTFLPEYQALMCLGLLTSIPVIVFSFRYYSAANMTNAARGHGYEILLM